MEDMDQNQNQNQSGSMVGTEETWICAEEPEGFPDLLLLL